MQPMQPSGSRGQQGLDSAGPTCLSAATSPNRHYQSLQAGGGAKDSGVSGGVSGGLSKASSSGIGSGNGIRDNSDTLALRLTVAGPACTGPACMGPACTGPACTGSPDGSSSGGGGKRGEGLLPCIAHLEVVKLRGNSGEPVISCD